MKKLIKFLEEVEGLELQAYKCTSGVWTIGIGNTYYEDGKKVKEGDTISRQRAFELAEIIVEKYCNAVKKHVKQPLTENQFIALVSFCYNIGPAAFQRSKILKSVNEDPYAPDIKKLFPISFITSKGKRVQGLVNRRMKECNLYFKK